MNFIHVYSCVEIFGGLAQSRETEKEKKMDEKMQQSRYYNKQQHIKSTKQTNHRTRPKVQEIKMKTTIKSKSLIFEEKFLKTQKINFDNRKYVSR